MNETTRDVTLTMLWLELERLNTLEHCFCYTSNLQEALKEGSIVMRTSIDEKLSAKLDRKDQYGKRINYVYHHQEDCVAEELKKLRKAARKLGWSIKQFHRSWWPRHDVARWCLFPTDERNKRGVAELFRKCY